MQVMGLSALPPPPSRVPPSDHLRGRKGEGEKPKGSQGTETTMALAPSALYLVGSGDLLGQKGRLLCDAA